MLPMMNNNNPIMALAQMMRSGGNIMPIIQQAAQKNPQIANVLKMTSGKNPQQLRQIAENIAKERGTSVEEIANTLGFQIPQ